MTYREGRHYVLDDRTGRKIYDDEAVREWTGAIVHRDHAIDRVRHPQEIQKTVQNEGMASPNARPRPLDTFGGPLKTLLTAGAAAGSVTVAVETSSRFQGGDEVGIMLASGDLHRGLLMTVPDATHLTFIDPLPGAVESGALVVNYTAFAPSDIV